MIDSNTDTHLKHKHVYTMQNCFMAEVVVHFFLSVVSAQAQIKRFFGTELVLPTWNNNTKQFNLFTNLRLVNLYNQVEICTLLICRNLYSGKKYYLLESNRLIFYFK